MLKGRTAVVTGGARGIGQAVALKMAENGADIAVIDVGSGEVAAETCRLAKAFGVKVKAYACPVEDAAQVKSVCEAITADFGKVDILVNNAGITRDQLLLRMSEEDFDRVIGVNLKGAFNFTKSLARVIMKSPSGRIINIASVVGLMGNAGQANYAASKAGIIGLSKTVAREFASRGVTCNAIAPGFIQTDMTANLPDPAQEKMKASIPLGRIGNASDVADLALFLASDSASYITGEVIRVDGGMAM